jgi:hypothetical protein
MQYRAEMRKQDQDELVKKRNNKRSSRKARESIGEVHITAQAAMPEPAGHVQAVPEPAGGVQAMPELGGPAQEGVVPETAAPPIELV